MNRVSADAGTHMCIITSIYSACNNSNYGWKSTRFRIVRMTVCGCMRACVLACACVCACVCALIELCARVHVYVK